MLTSFLVLVMLAQAPGPPAKAGQVTVSKPRAVLQIAGDTIRGTPVKLSWSPDGQTMYLLSVERDLWGNEKDHHFLLGLSDGSVRAFEGEPLWSVQYWAWKSGVTCPGAPTFKIETESRTERVTATGAGAGGSIAQNSGDPYAGGAALGPQGSAIFAVGTQSQNVTTTTFKLKGHVLAEFVNTRPVLGLTYSWAPHGLDVIAFSNEKHELELMDAAGARTQMKSIKGVVLPAWSDDGRRLAWLTQKGRGKFALVVADVGRDQ